MRSVRVLTLLAATLLMTPVASHAQPGPGFRHGGPGGPGGPRGPGGPGGPGGPRGAGGWHGWRPGPHGWRQGDYFAGWRTRNYMVSNWRGYPGLYAPPAGYYWTRYGNQFLLTAIATGMISAVIGGAMAPGAPPPPY